MKRCSIVVFGDVGRSPRMVNHALAIAQNSELQINLFAYKENNPPEVLTQNRNIRVIDLRNILVSSMKKLPSIFYLFYVMVRIMIQSFLLFIQLLKKQEFILVQNPPSIPTLHILFLIRLLRRTRIVLDMHNYGYTLLNTKSRLILYLARKYEQVLARQFDVVLCVSDAMRIDLLSWGIKAHVIHDRANTSYLPLQSIKEKQELLQKLQIGFDDLPLIVDGKSNQKTALLVSSTSWTMDEDFHILIKALDLYDEHFQRNKNFKVLYIVITGKGPMKEYYGRIFRSKQYQGIQVEFKWLTAEDYPKLLSIADAGICLHCSSSGVDLPMKVVDLFSVGTPVFAKNFPAIPELVQHQVNGILFNTGEDLFDYFVFTLAYNSTVLQDYRKRVEPFRNITWEQEWKRIVKPLLRI